MRVTRPNPPYYCSECEADHSLRVLFQNPQIGQNASFALCLKHAETLASQLLQHVRKARLEKSAGGPLGGTAT